MADLTVIRLKTNCGPGGGKNRLLECALGAHDAIALLDNDVVVLDGWDRAALDCINAGADLVQPKLLRRDLRFLERGRTVPNPDPLAANPLYVGSGSRRDDPLVNARASCAIVGSGIVRTEVFRSIGVFDERFFIGEDYDLSFRAQAAGYRLLYEPACEVVHDHPCIPSYDIHRSDSASLLRSDLAMWEKHGKLLHDPRWLYWRMWLMRNGEPEIVEWNGGIRDFSRRIRRRLMMSFFMNTYPKKWKSRETADGAMRRLRRALAA